MSPHDRREAHARVATHYGAPFVDEARRRVRNILWGCAFFVVFGGLVGGVLLLVFAIIGVLISFWGVNLVMEGSAHVFNVG